MREDGADPVLMEALEWFVRMHDDKATPTDQAEFQVWLAQDDAHTAAWRRAESLWTTLDVAQPEFDRLRRSQVILSRRQVTLGALVLAAGAGGLYLRNREDLFPEYATAIGERKSFTLPDGSRVELGSYSALSANFTENTRRVDLFRGEGFFDVASDPSRPFIVRAASGDTQALGTKFDVKFVDSTVTVAVREHAVNVQVDEASSVYVAEGWEVSYEARKIGTPTPVNWDVTDAWRQDRIVFQDVPLRLVLAELERYRPGRIVLMSKKVGDIPVTAIFETKQADSALRTIASSLPIHVVNATGYLTLVFSAA